MKKQRRILISFLVMICMLFSINNPVAFAQDIDNSYNPGNSGIPNNQDSLGSELNAAAIGAPAAVTGSALVTDTVTYYVGGGTGTASGTIGEKSEYPFATLYDAMAVINKKPGNYNIILQGDTTESRAIVIGDGINTYNVTISSVEAVSGSAISLGTVSDNSLEAVSGAAITSTVTEASLIQVLDHAGLTLKGGTKTSSGLTFLGSSNSAHALFRVNPEGSLKLLPGVILKNNNTSNNPPNYYDVSTLCGGIYNLGSLIMEGGSISDNIGKYYGGVYNEGSFIMSGGTITGNSGNSSGGVYNTGTFTMSGGDISYNSSNCAEGVNNNYNSEFNMTGGTIAYASSAYAGIYNSGTFRISGNASITGTSDAIDILLLKAATIYLDGNLTGDDHISVDLSICSPDLEVLSGNAEIIKNNYQKFFLHLHRMIYSLADTGCLKYHASICNYYVDGSLGSDTNPGTLEAPFATIDKAAYEIYLEGDVGTINICSDINITKPLVLSGTITIKNYGEKHTIFRSGNFDDYMFINYGSLTLGDIEKDGTDQTCNLVLDGNNLKNRGSMINNSAILKLYPGVVIQNCATTDAGGVFNEGKFTMYGGSISHNPKGGVLNLDDGTFIMKGGSITDNSSTTGAGVCNEGTFIMEGGTISNNSALYAGSGVYCMKGKFILKDDAVISGNNDVFINVYEKGNAVTIGGKLQGTAPVATINTGFDDIELNPDVPIVVSGEGYQYTKEDLAKITLSDSRFFLNSAGVINAALKDSYVDISCSKVLYVGSEIKPTVYVKMNSDLLKEGKDYKVTYENNTNAGIATYTVEGLGNYCGKVTKSFEIEKANISRVITAAPADQTFQASENKTEAELLAAITQDSMEVEYIGGVARLPITWKLIGGTFNPKGGTYIYRGTPTDKRNFNTETASLITKITVKAVELNKPSFEDIIIAKGKNPKATAKDLGSSVLPTAGSIKMGTDVIHYKIKWDNHTLDTTRAEESATFTGAITYTDVPAWATVPSKLLVKRTVSVAQDTSFVIDASVDGCGDITPKGNVIVNRHANQTFTISPRTDYQIKDVLVDGKSVGAIDKYSFSDTLKNHTIKAYFTQIIEPLPEPSPIATVTPKPTDGGQITPVPDADSIKTVQAEVSVLIERNEAENELNTSVSVSEAEVLDRISKGETSQQTIISIPISSGKLTGQLSDSGISKANINVTVPDSLLTNAKIAGCDITLASDILQTAKDTGKDITVAVKDEKGTERYSWTFAGSELAASDNEITDLNLSLKVERPVNNSELAKLLKQGTSNGNDSSNSLVINFSHHGELPSPAKVKLYVGDMGFTAGQTLYLYYYNSETGKLDTLPYSSDYQVDSDGYVTISVVHCSEYVLLPQKADSKKITSLLNQIDITAKASVLYLGKTDNSTIIDINLPTTLKLVKNLQDSIADSGEGAVVVSFKSNNLKIAAVDSQGNITAKGIGKAVISVYVTLYSGKTKIVKLPISVKKPYISLTKSIDTLEKGKNFIFEAKAYGLEEGDITWSTTKPSIIVINKKTGKATAKAKGTAYVAATVDKVTVKKKVVVK